MKGDYLGGRAFGTREIPTPLPAHERCSVSLPMLSSIRPPIRGVHPAPLRSLLTVLGVCCALLLGCSERQDLRRQHAPVPTASVADGAPPKANVTQAALKNSVHARLDCSDCHSRRDHYNEDGSAGASKHPAPHLLTPHSTRQHCPGKQDDGKGPGRGISENKARANGEEYGVRVVGRGTELDIA